MQEPVGILLRLFDWLFGCLRGRPKLSVRISEDDPEKEKGGLRFEVENRSHTSTSLAPRVEVKFLTYKGMPAQMIFDVRELNRHLPPFQPKLFSASAHAIQPDRFHGWFRTYTFRPTRGRVSRVRIRNALLEEVGLLRFVIEKLRFKFSGQVRVKASMTIDEYRARKRAQGPH